ncbi:MAG TPA: cytochrome P450 [Solirubrobacterales bacterium]|nr:cytochrome P450 [Solirubrobacterales bacterium]
MPLQTWRWIRDPIKVLERGRDRYGDTFTLRLPHEGTWVVTSDPDDIKRIFTAAPSEALAGEANRILLPILGPSSVLLLDGEAHIAQRRLLLPRFHGERMVGYGDLMGELAAVEAASWPVGVTFTARPRMQALTFEIIMRAVFGVEGGARQQELRELLRTLLERISDPRSFGAVILLGPERIQRFAFARRGMERVDRLLFEEIAARRRDSELEERVDILSLLVQATHPDGAPMSDPEIRDEVMTLLVAGHETTATALSWALERLARHPEIADRLALEIAAGEDTYLDAVVKEVLRLRPVIALVLRRLVEPMEIGGRVLPAGVKVVPCIHLLHRRPEIYADPERFRPERFLEHPAGTYTWIPFGGGVRRCLGAAFAEFEMRAVLREIVFKWRIEAGRSTSEPLRRRSITNVPGHGARIRVSAR